MNIPLQNYHSHTTYSDGKENLSAFMQEAYRKGVIKIGISDHSPVPFPSTWNMKIENIEKYLFELHTCALEYIAKNKPMEVISGIEVDFINGIQSNASFHKYKKGNYKNGMGLDYTIGSVHYLCKNGDDSWWNHDSSPKGFTEGLTNLYGSDIKKLVKAYYSAIRTMLEIDPPDILGHLDLIKKFNGTLHLFDEDDKWYKNEVEQTLDCLKVSKAILEINTSYLYRMDQQAPYPSVYILERALEKKIPIVINSDAHSVGNIDAAMDKCRLIISEVEMRKNRVFCEMTFDAKNGLFIER